jgi:extracellular elastinolytic metalloproteinase
MGQYVINDAAGIRTHPYSTSKITNPLTYARGSQCVTFLCSVLPAADFIPSDIGEVWANLLHNVYAALVGDLGFSKTAHTDPTGTEGNVVYLHLFLDALALQPCSPTLCVPSLLPIQLSLADPRSTALLPAMHGSRLT